MIQNSIRDELESKLEQARLRLVAVVEHTTTLQTLRHSRDELHSRIQMAIDKVGNSATALQQEINLAYPSRLQTEE